MNGDSQLLDFMDDNAVQAWPERQRRRAFSWTVQLPKPFLQVSRPTLRMALRDLMFKAEQTANMT
jgi:hypothetical protein